MLCGLEEEPGALLITDLAEGRLYRRQDATGQWAPFGPELPHGTDVIGDPAGPYRVANYRGGYLVAQGWTPVDAVEDPRDHALLMFDATGETRILDDDFWNPFAFVTADETIYVVDAARNTVESLGMDGDRRNVVAFPRIEHSGAAMRHLSPTEFAAGEAYEVDAVPTGIAARDGRLYVSLFGGFPYLAGGGAVVSIDPELNGSERRVEVDGLDAPVGVAFLPTGELLVLEHGAYNQASGFIPGTGRLLWVGSHGERHTLIDELTRPTSVLVRKNGEIIVTGLDGKLLFLTKEPNSRGN